MAYNVSDRAGNPVSLKTVTDGTNLSGTAAIVDAGGTTLAEVASRVGAGNQAPGSGNAVQVAAIPMLTNAAGNWDALRKGGVDVMSARGIQTVSNAIGTRTAVTTSTSVSSSSATATLAASVTAGFVVGGIVGLEPGTARYEAAEITGVVANTSVSVAFPSGGALFTHTASYTIETFQPSMLREAPGRQGAALVSSDGTKPTYRAGANAQTFYSTAAAVLVEIVGSSSKTVRVKYLSIWARAASQVATELELLRATAASGGSATAANLGKHDVNDANATAVVNYYTAAAAAGTGGTSNIIGANPMIVAAPTAAGVVKTTWDFSRLQDKALILRGTGDVVEVY
ncbi:MAG TPA: hypothetical protein VGR45_10995, partial [Stellaceae bacterium]|nr:hypothetical protein [Stellaceae bacterium]